MPHAIGNFVNPFFTHDLNFPDGVNLMWNSWIPLPALLLAPITMTLGPIFSFNLLITLALTFSAWCAYLCIRRYVGRHECAIIGGLIYGFSPYFIAHAHAHPNLALGFIPPLMFLLLDDILVRQTKSFKKLGIMLGLLAGAQVVITTELLATEAIAAACGLIVLMLLYPRKIKSHFRYAIKSIGLAFGVFVLVALTPLTVMFLGPQHPTNGALFGPNTYVSDAYGFVTPSSLQQVRFKNSEEITSKFTDACCIDDTHSYLGWPLVFLLLEVTVSLWFRGIVRFTAITGLLVAVISMGPYLHIGGRVTTIPLPYKLLSEVPVISNMLTSRMMIYVYLFAGLLTAISIDNAFDLWKEHKRRGVVTVRFVLLTLALVFLFPKVPFPTRITTVPSFFTTSAVKTIPKNSVALVAPFARDTNTSDPMMWHAYADMRYKMPEGYILGPDGGGKFTFLPIPTTLSTTMEAIQLGKPIDITPEMQQAMRDEIKTKKVKTIVVGPMAHQDEMMQLFNDLLGAQPESLEGVYLWRI